ncbi:MAG TPA: Spy/CpxP family protein refolding chaperone [Bryobacteraceae bacterium]|nr:Spy/CpxP family protein refolding chaperone [Bryobacteraceae bacterium]
MRTFLVALLLIGASVLQAQTDPRLSPPAQVDLLHLQSQQLQQQLQQQQAIQSQQAQQQVQQMQFQRQADEMMDGPNSLFFGTPAIAPRTGIGLLSGKWWDRPALAARIGLTPDQQKKMDGIYQQARLHMIDLNAALQKEQARLDPMLTADQPDETAMDAQIDRVANARAGLEKANTGMILEIRRALSPEQWTKLKAAINGD